MIRIQRMQFPFNISGPRRLCVNRVSFIRPNDYHFGFKISTSIVFEPRDLWVGAYWRRESGEFFLYLCVIPMMPIRFHFKRSYGGRFG